MAQSSERIDMTVHQLGARTNFSFPERVFLKLSNWARDLADLSESSYDSAFTQTVFGSPSRQG